MDLVLEIINARVKITADIWLLNGSDIKILYI